MHDIEPYYKWRDYYDAADDKKSPFYGREYSEFIYSNKIYNYYIHPQWDEIGSPTLYAKLIFVDYDKQFGIIELIGEWNDAINNDVMFLKREVVDKLESNGIKKYLLLCDNVLNFHADDDSYYEEWYEDIRDEGGWICMVNLLEHVLTEMETVGIQFYANIGPQYNDINWQGKKASHIIEDIEFRLRSGIKQLRY